MKARDLQNIPANIPDVQASPDSRKLAIDQVGIKAIRHPVKIKERPSADRSTGGVQHTIALFNMYVGLPHHFKGTHMSRFVETRDYSDSRARSIFLYDVNLWLLKGRV